VDRKGPTKLEAWAGVVALWVPVLDFEIAFATDITGRPLTSDEIALYIKPRLVDRLTRS
jgi:hypothetical protein